MKTFIKNFKEAREITPWVRGLAAQTQHPHKEPDRAVCTPVTLKLGVLGRDERIVGELDLLASSLALGSEGTPDSR